MVVLLSTLCRRCCGVVQ